MSADKRIRISAQNPAGQASDRPESHECITILAHGSADALAEFNRLNLGGRGFAITGSVMRHRFVFAGADSDDQNPLGGRQLYAATFVRMSSQEMEV